MAGIPFKPPVWDDLLQGIRRFAAIATTDHGRAPLADLVPVLATQALAAVTPRSLFRKTALVTHHQGIISGQGLTIKSPKLASLVARMERPQGIYAVSLTLGERIDRLISETERISLAQALVLDAAGTVLIEHYAGLIEGYLRARYQSQGLEVSDRFSPGYCDWDLNQGQAELDRFLMPEAIGVSMYASGAMSPVKSITGILITAAGMPARVPCVWCPKASCRHRR